MVETKREGISEFVKRWGSDQWESAEWRQYLISFLDNYEEMMDRLSNYEMVCNKQKEEITSLEKQCELLHRQLKLLQKTLDVAERFSRPIIIPGAEKERKGGGLFG
jgi:hypothetical protein